MRHLKLFATLSVSLIIGLASCSDDGSQEIRGDDGNPSTGNGNGNNNSPNNQPKINFEETPNDIQQPGDSVTYQVTLQSSTGETNLDKLTMEIMAKNSGGSFTALPEYTKNKDLSPVPTTGTKVGFRLKNEDFENYDSVKAKFTLTDMAENNTVNSHLFGLGEIFRDRYVAAGGDSVIRINHRLTPIQPPDNKFDLYYEENNVTVGYVPGAGSEATIKDDSKDSFTFNRRWATETEASFVKANNSDINYNRPFDLEIQKAYANGTPSSSVINISQGDLIIVKLRSPGNNFALLQIETVAEDQQNPRSSYISFKGRGANIYQ